MRKFLPTAFLASCALSLGLTAGSLATASYSPDPEAIDTSHEFETVEMIAPVMSDELFAGQTAGATCMDHSGVMRQIAADRAQIGGEAVELSAGQDQIFADAWRHETGEGAIAISGIVGHVYFDETATEWMVDVTEFDPAGCAASRTIISGKQWNHLINAAGTV